MRSDSQDVFQRLLTFTERLNRAKIHHRLDQVRPEGIMVEIAVPGDRWEVEFMADGSVDVERFRSDGQICGAEAIEKLFEQSSDAGDQAPSIKAKTN
jgi:hypothetical protein